MRIKIIRKPPFLLRIWNLLSTKTASLNWIPMFESKYIYNEKPHFLVGFNIAQKAFKPSRRRQKKIPKTKWLIWLIYIKWSLITDIKCTHNAYTSHFLLFIPCRTYTHSTMYFVSYSQSPEDIALFFKKKREYQTLF